MKRVLVIGAGITGVTTAYYLAKAGHEVVVYDRERYAGMMTSHANGGQLSVSNSETWTTWSNVYKGLKWMFDSSAPLLVRLSPSYDKLKWMAGFLYETIRGSHVDYTKATIELGLKARQLYYDIADETGIDFDLSKSGILHFYKSEKYFNSAKQAVKNIYEPMGVDRKVLSWDELVEVEPMLMYSPGIIGGTYTKDDAMGDIHKFCNRLSLYLEKKHRVSFKYDHEVINVEKLSDTYTIETNKGIDIFDHVVICAGSDSARLAELFDENIFLYPIKGYSVTISGSSYLPRVSLLDDEAKIVTSTLGNRLRVAGTAELDGWNLDIRKSRIDPLMKWVAENFRSIDTKDFKPWAGLRPMTPSMFPIIRKGDNKGVYFNTGHGHLGWTLSPATAQIITEMINGD